MLLRKGRALAASSVILLGLFACKTAEKDSRVSGHYENFSEAELLPYKGKVRIIPEFEESSGVIISVEAVDRFNLYPLLQAFQDHPQKPYVLLPVLHSDYSTPPDTLQRFLNSSQFSLYSIPQNPNHIEDDITWTRDWAPWTESFKPQPTSPAEARFADFNYYELRNVADELPQLISAKLSIPRLSVPIRTEGGNFMINNRGDCMMTTGVIEREALIRGYSAQLAAYKKARDESGFPGYDKVIARYEALVSSSTSYNKEQIEEFFKDYAGCKQIIWLAPSPSDINQHIDLFAKFLSDDIVLVMDLEDQTIATLPKNHDPTASLDIMVAQALLKSVQSHLNEVTNLLRTKGFKVVRAPLPLTMIYKDLEPHERAKLPLVKAGSRVLESARSGRALDLELLYNEGLSVHMRSYANSLIMKPYVYVPRFRAPVLEDGNGAMAILGGDGSATTEYPDASLLTLYEKSVEKAYGEAGLTVTWIEADQTVPYQGSIHCLTEQIGRIPPAP